MYGWPTNDLLYTVPVTVSYYIQWSLYSSNKIIPARDPKQCKTNTKTKTRVVIPRTNRYTRGSWGHGKLNITQRRSSWAGSRRPEVAGHENYHEKSTSVLGPDVGEHRKVRDLRRKIDISSWAGCCTTPKSTGSTTKNKHQFLGRMLQNTQKYGKYHEKWTSVLGPDIAENCHEKWTSVLGPDVAEHRKTRELPRKMNREEVQPPKKPKKYEFYCENPVEEHPRTPKSTRITTKNEHRRSWRAEKYEKCTRITTRNPFQALSRPWQITEKYENYHEKWTSKKLRSTLATPPLKLRKFTHKTNMQARKHKNSHEFCPPPRSSHPAFYSYRKNPKCYPHCLGKYELLIRSVKTFTSKTANT